MATRDPRLGDVPRYTGYVLGALLLQVALHPVLSTYPVPAALLSALVVLGFSFYKGLLDGPAVVGFVSAPFRAANTLRRVLLITGIGLGCGALLLEWIEVLTWIPGTLLVVFVLGFLIREIRAPWQRFEQVRRMAMDFDDPPVEQKLAIAEMLRKQTPAREEASPAERLQRLLESEDAKEDLSYNLPAWQVVWISFCMVMGLALLFPAVGALAPGAFEGDDIRIWRWFLFGLEQIMLDDPVELFGVNEFLEDRLGSPSIELSPPGLAVAILSLRIAVSVILVRAVVAHFEILSSLKRLVRASGTPRFRDLRGQRAFERLRVLRPIAEVSLGRMLAREMKVLRSRPGEVDARVNPNEDPGADPDPNSMTARTLISLLRQPPNLPTEWTRSDWSSAHFQTRLAVARTLSETGYSLTPGWVRERFPELSPSYILPDQHGVVISWEALSRNQAEVPRVAGFARDIFSLLRGLAFTPDETSSESLEEWILRPDSAWPSDWKRMVLDDGRFMILLACLARCRDRDVLLRMLAHVPGAAREMRRAWGKAWPDHAPVLTVEEEGRWVAFCNALDAADGFLGDLGISKPILQRVKTLKTPAIDTVLLDRLRRAQSEGDRGAIYTAMAEVGLGDRALGALIDRWQYGPPQEERPALVAGLSRLGKGQTEVLGFLADSWARNQDPHLWTTLLRALTWIGHDAVELHSILAMAHQQPGLDADRRQAIWTALCLLRGPAQLARLSTWRVASVVDKFGLVFRKQRLPDPITDEPEGAPSSFWLADFPVTESVWNVGRGTASAEDGDASVNEELALPKVGITWHEARAFCAELSSRACSGVRYRLPTALEWQGEASLQLDAVSHDPSARQWNIGGITGGPSHRGAYPPDAFGIFDRLGNVWEWCQKGPDTAHGPDGYGRRSSQPVCGGCWDTRPENLKPGAPVWLPALTASPRVGFRLVMEPADPDRIP